MKKTVFAVFLMLLGAHFMLCNAQEVATVSQLEDDIQYQEDVVDDNNDSIAAINERIAVLKAKLDSLNNECKDVKNQISALEKEKKGYQKQIKDANKARQLTYATRDNLVFEEEIQDVLMSPYSKVDVDNALKSFEGMETKDVLKKKALVENYGKYTKELRDLLDDYRIKFERQRWAVQSADSELYKKFHKALKSTGYYKVYNKGINNSKEATIPYLDKVMEEILLMERQGFNSRALYDKVVGMLYGAK